MISFLVPDDLYRACQEHLNGDVEQAGFFLAEWTDGGQFEMREWRPLAEEDLEFQGRSYLEIDDQARADIIRWAGKAGLSLVEVHSHIDWPVAAFSASDVHGFRDWVPHIWWRLAGRPYAAMVMCDGTFDALAWITGPGEPEQVKYIRLGTGTVLPATGATLNPTRPWGGAHV